MKRVTPLVLGMILIVKFSNAQIPLQCRIIADSVLISNLGQQSFFENIEFDCSNSYIRSGSNCYYCLDSSFFSKKELKSISKHRKIDKSLPVFYTIAYKFRVIDTCKSAIEVTLNSSGRVTKVLGLPNCLIYPDLCKLAVNRNHAIAIAKDFKFKEGTDKWQLTLKWNDGRQIDTLNINPIIDFKHGRFIWELKNILGGEFIKHSSGGEYLHIDAKTGGKFYTKNYVWISQLNGSR